MCFTKPPSSGMLFTAWGLLFHETDDVFHTGSTDDICCGLDFMNARNLVKKR